MRKDRVSQVKLGDPNVALQLTLRCYKRGHSPVELKIQGTKASLFADSETRPVFEPLAKMAELLATFATTMLSPNSTLERTLRARFYSM